MRFMHLLTFLFILSSCTILTKEECESIDWVQKGSKDALEGRTKDEFQDYQMACSENGVKISKRSYYKGFIQGLRKFCTYKSGYQFGLQDRYYRSTCPPKAGKKFLRGYNQGIKEAELQEREEELNRREQELQEESEDS